MPECDRCREPLEPDDKGFVVDCPGADFSELLCRQCREPCTDSGLGRILAEALEAQHKRNRGDG